MPSATQMDLLHTTPPTISCNQTENLYGGKVPPAKKQQDRNPDGYYELIAIDICDPDPEIFVYDTRSNTKWPEGPDGFSSGVKIKYTVKPGATPEIKKIGSGKGKAKEIDYHIIGTGPTEVHAVDHRGNVSICILSN